MKHRGFISIVLVSLFVLMPVSQVMAQGGTRGECQQFIHRAYTSLGTNCLKLDANAVCYGHQDITGMVTKDQTELDDFFDEPGYRSALTPIARVTGFPFNLDEEGWGLAKLNIQVFTDDIEPDDPETLDDNMRDVLMLLMGDVEVENARDPVFDAEGNLIIDADTPGPMQEFFLRNGYDAPDCPEAPLPLLLVQGTDDADTSISVNGLEIELNAGDTQRPLPTTVILQIMPPGDSMRILVLAGMATLNPDTANEFLLPAGYWTIVCLDEPQDRGTDGEANDRLVSCPLAEPELVSDQMITMLEGIEGLPGNVLKKPIILPAILRASGAGGVIVRIIFGDMDALELARQACEANLLPPGICNQLFR